MVNLIRNKRIEGISDIRNESGRKGMRIVVEVKRDANPQVVLNLLYKYSQLQDTFAINMLALVNNQPKTLNLKEVIVHYINHQEDVITRRTKFELEKAEREAHIYEGLKIAIDNIDEVINVIRNSANVSEARENLKVKFNLTDLQSQAIVEMTLGRLSGLERKKIEERLETLYALITELKGILSDRQKILDIIKTDLLEIKKKHGDERRTDIQEAEDEILLEDLIERENCVVTVTHAGYIKRLPAETYQAQRRGGKGITAMSTRDEDFVEDVIVSHSHDFVLLFSNKGRMYIKKCYEIPSSGRTAKGTNLVNVLSLDEEEKITAIIPVLEFTEDENLVLMTKQGVIKRVSLMSYQTRRSTGFHAINLDEGDELLYVMKTTGHDHIIAASRNGQSIRFDEDDVRIMGRQARGVRGMRLDKDDYIVGAAVIPKDYEEDQAKVLTITESGYGKRSEIEEFSLQKRGGKGIICHRTNEKTGALAGISIVAPTDDIMLITDQGIIIRTKVDEIPVYGRATAGVIMMRVSEEASIVGFAKVSEEEEEETENNETESKGTQNHESEQPEEGQIEEAEEQPVT